MDFFILRLSAVNLTKNIHLISVGGLAELPWSGHKAIAVMFLCLQIITIIPKTTHRCASHCSALLALFGLLALPPLLVSFVLLVQFVPLSLLALLMVLKSISN